MAAAKLRTVRKMIRTTPGLETFSIPDFGDVVAALFISTTTRVNNTQRANSVIGIGFTDGTNNVNVGASSQDATSGSNTRRSASITKCVEALVGSTSATLFEGDFDSFTTDGIIIDFTKAPASGTLVTCVLIGGGTTDAFAGFKDLGTGTAPVDITDPGFEPDLVLIAGVGASSDIVLGVNAILHLGFAHKGGNQKGISFSDQDSQVTTNVSMSTRSADVNGQVFNASQVWFATVGEVANGFSMTPNVSTGSDRVYYLALKFSSDTLVSAFSQDSPTVTGSKSYTEPGFLPDFGMIALSDNTVEDAQQSSGNDGLAISTFDADNQFCNTWSSEDGVLTSNANSLSDSIVIHDIAAGSVDQNVATFTSFDETGWTFNFTTAPLAARKWAGFAVGSAAAGGVSLTGPLTFDLTGPLTSELTG